MAAVVTTEYLPKMMGLLTVLLEDVLEDISVLCITTQLTDCPMRLFQSASEFK